MTMPPGNHTHRSRRRGDGLARVLDGAPGDARLGTDPPERVEHLQSATDRSVARRNAICVTETAAPRDSAKIGAGGDPAKIPPPIAPPVREPVA